MGIHLHESVVDRDFDTVVLFGDGQFFHICLCLCFFLIILQPALMQMKKIDDKEMVLDRYSLQMY